MSPPRAHPERISRHITYREATQSQTAARRGIPNTPGPLTIKAMQLVAELVFEPVRAHFGVPIFVSSFFRSPELNKAIGGARNSQHCTGEAIDLDADVFGGVSNAEVFDYIRRNLIFDQLIWEFGTARNPEWVHVSYTAGVNRKQVLKALKVEGRTKYVPWTP